MDKRGKYTNQLVKTRKKEVRDLEEGGIDSFHIDIMDGRYVPNFAMSLNDMAYIASAAKKPLDVHLMIEHPNNIHIFLEKLRGTVISYNKKNLERELRNESR